MPEVPPHPEPPAASPLLHGPEGSELAALIARHDWASTSMGPLASWPAHVRVAVETMLRSPVAMVTLWGEDGVMVYNDAYAAFSAQRHPGILGMRVREAWPEASDFNDHVVTTGLQGRTLIYRDQELTLHHHGRPEQVWLNLDYSPIVDAAGRPAGVFCVVVDTTEKVLALRRLDGERERMAQMFEQAPGFMALLSGPTHVYSLVNPSYSRLVGGRPLLGRTVAQALPETVGQGFVALLDEVYATGVAFSAVGVRYSMPAPDGGPPLDRYLDFVYQPVRDAAGQVEGIFVEGTDVTERVLAEVLRDRLVALGDRLSAAATPEEVGYAAAELLGQALDADRVGYGLLDPDSGILHVDRDWCAPGVESLAGETPLRDYGTFVDGLARNEFIAIRDVREDDRTRVAADALAARSARAFVNVPVTEQGRLVGVFFVNSAKARNWLPQELALIREVGERTRASSERVRAEMELRARERELREMNETLEAKVDARTRELMVVEEQFRQAQKMEAIGQLTGGIAHDFNNLLHSMSMSTEVLQRKLETGRLDGWERYVGMSQQAVRRAASLTQRLLAFSRRQALDPRPTDINKLVGGLEDLIRGTVGPSVELRIAVEGGTRLARVDAPQLENAVLNLCINARDAMQPGGGVLSVAVTGCVLDAAHAGRLDLAPGEYTCIAVSDTGSGMPPEVQARAFDPFFTTKPQGLGTGLGLSMVYGFVRQSGGQVGIDSEVGRGTVVTLYLPRDTGEQDADQPVSRHAAAAGTGSGEAVLLVEDEATIRQLLREELERAGYRVLAGATGAEGLAVLQSRQRIDLLVTDVGLPGGLNGRQVADAGRALRPGLSVLFITGYADAAAALGGDQLPEGMEVIGKPFDTADLVARVRGLLARKNPAAAE